MKRAALIAMALAALVGCSNQPSPGDIADHLTSDQTERVEQATCEDGGVDANDTRIYRCSVIYTWSRSPEDACFTAPTSSASEALPVPCSRLSTANGGHAQ